VKRLIAAAVVAALAVGCALYTDVSINALIITPSSIDRGADLPSMIRKFDYLRAIELTSSIENRQRKNISDLMALGEAELAAGRYDAARQHLRAAIDLDPFRTTFSQVAWDLSQVEYMCNNFESSLEWAQLAQKNGLPIKDWHLDYLRALSATEIYRFSGSQSDRVAMQIGHPDVPRIDVRMNDKKNTFAIVDSGAVLSIVSDRLAKSLPVRSVGTFQGTFFGLLDEPIQVNFGVLDSLEIGGIKIENVPVAIMPSDKMRFLVASNEQFEMDLLLGANLLKEFRVEFDYKKSSAFFTHLAAEDRVPDKDQNLFIEAFRPMVRGTVNRKGWFLFILDTGSEVTFLNQTHLAALPISFYAPRMHDALLQGLGGAKKRGEKVENIELGIDRWGGTFRTLPMYESDDRAHAVGIIGENFLKNFRVVIDFGKMRVDLIRG